MGLAASQARLLMLTARKNDVESQLMSIANQKLTLSRESSEISQKYSNALNSTTQKVKIVDSDLAYSDLMVYNSASSYSSQYVLTDNNDGNKVILSSSDEAAKFKLSGTSGDKGRLSTDSATEAGILATLTNITSADAIKTYLDGGAGSGGTVLDYDDSDAIAETAYNNEYKTASCISLSDYDVSGHTLISALSKFEGIVSEIGDDLLGAIKKTTGKSNLDGYMDAAVKATILIFEGGDDDVTESDLGYKKNVSGSNYNSASGTNLISFQDKNNNGSDHTGRWNVDIKQVIDTLLNFFDIAYQNGYDDSTASKGGNDLYAAVCCRGNLSSNYKYFYSDGNKTTTRIGKSTSPGGTGSPSYTLTDSDKAKLSYYINLYNAINANGWKINSNVSNSASLQSSVLNGDILVQKIGANGVLTDATNDSISEEEDDNAIEKAKSEYEASKDKLDYKESMLDLQQNDLDTERSSIQTELESVKTIIDKNIEKFKMFQSG